MSLERRLFGLHPQVQSLARVFVLTCLDKGITIRVTQGVRSMHEQEMLYAQGRTSPGRIVTNAKPGYSWHNFGLAFDIMPVNAETHMGIWDDKHPVWAEVGAIGQGLGLEWGGAWRTFKDLPHFQLIGDLTFEKVQSLTPDSLWAYDLQTQRV